MVAFFEQHTVLQFVDGNGIPDMHGDTPGAATGGHQVIAAPYDAREVGALLPRLRKTMRETSFMGMPIMAGADLAAFLNMTRSPRALLHVIRRFTTHLYHLARYGRAMHLVNGVALIARLARSAQDLGVQMMNQMIPALKNMIPDAPPAFWDDVMQEVNAEELENLLIPVYQKHLTEADVKALNEFYASDVGQKMIKTQPAIMRESMMLGQQWGQQLAQKIVQRYESQKAK